MFGEQSNWEQGRKNGEKIHLRAADARNAMRATVCTRSVGGICRRNATAIACLPVGVAAQRCRSFCGWTSVLSRKRAVIFHSVTGQDSRLTYDAAATSAMKTRSMRLPPRVV